VHDEANLQGVMIFRRDVNTLNKLLESVSPLVEENDIYVQTRRVRGGHIIAFSLEAITESTIDRIISERESKMSFAARIDHAFDEIPPVVEDEVVEEQEVDLEASARKIVAETNLATTSATGGMERSNQTTRQRQKYTQQDTYGGVEHPASPKSNEGDKKKVKSEGGKGVEKGATKHPSLGPASRRLSFESKVSSALGVEHTARPDGFRKQLHETLQGMATKTGAQPNDLFDRFAHALTVLSTQLDPTGTEPPLHQQLKQQGINWMKSDDGISLIMYVVNAATKAKQPIARITAETLENSNDFKTQLNNMLDFAHGNAPGTTEQQREQIRNQEKATQDVANAVVPQEQGEVEQQMQQPTAGQQAATTAASPKSTAAPTDVRYQNGVNQVATDPHGRLTTRRGVQQRV